MSWLRARFNHGEKFTYYEALVVALVGLQISRLIQEFKTLNEIIYKIIHQRLKRKEHHV